MEFNCHHNTHAVITYIHVPLNKIMIMARDTCTLHGDIHPSALIDLASFVHLNDSFFLHPSALIDLASFILIHL